MTWDESDEARAVYKFMKSGCLAPEDLTHGEIRKLRRNYPRIYQRVKMYLEERHRRIENGEWSMEDEPPDNDRRIKRYEHNEGIVDIWDGRNNEHGKTDDDS